jgi:uncharacterized protein (DUF1330 family)
MAHSAKSWCAATTAVAGEAANQGGLEAKSWLDAAATGVGLRQAAVKGAGGRFLAAGQKVTAIEGDPPKTRVVIQVWDRLEKMQAAYKKMQAAYNLPEYNEARKIGDKYAKSRDFAA